MANKDAAFGMKPIKMIGGAPYSGGQSRYRIAANYNTAIFQGDMVAQVTGGALSARNLVIFWRRCSLLSKDQIVGVLSMPSCARGGEPLRASPSLFYPIPNSASPVIFSFWDHDQIINLGTYMEVGIPR